MKERAKIKHTQKSIQVYWVENTMEEGGVIYAKNITHKNKKYTEID